MTLNDSQEEIKRKVVEYFEYAVKDNNIKLYDSEEMGLWRVIGGSGETGRETIGLLKGRYIDAIAWAVEQDGFYGDWCSSSVVDNPNSGYIKKARPLAVPKLAESASLEGVILNLKLNKEEYKMKTIAWNVDTQYDFMSPLGKLYVPGAEDIEPNLERLTIGFEEKGIQIINSGDWHTEESKEISSTPDFVHTFPEHCMIGTPGAEYVPATKPLNPVVVDWRQGNINLDEILGAKEVVLYKDEFDVFSGTPYSEKVLEAIDPDRVIVYGVATNVCVDFAVKGLLSRGKEVYVVEDAIKGLPNIPSPVEDWKRLGAKFIRTEDLFKDDDLYRYDVYV